VLLTVDIGNTNIVLGLFDHNPGGTGEDATLLHDWRMRADARMTADEMALTVRGLLGEYVEGEGAGGKPNNIQGGQRARAHGVDIRESVGGGDGAEPVGVVDDGREEVDRLDQGQIVAEAVHSGIVVRRMTDENVRIVCGL